MARYRLLAGQFIHADKSKPLLDADGNPTGRFESVTHTATSTNKPVVTSDTDLVAKHGPQKFELLDGHGEAASGKIARLEAEIVKLKSQVASSAGGFRTPGDPTPENLLHSPSVAPGGQVSTGFQGAIDMDDRPADAGEGLDADLDHLTVKELREYANENEINLHGATTRDDILKAIRNPRE